MCLLAERMKHNSYSSIFHSCAWAWQNRALGFTCLSIIFKFLANSKAIHIFYRCPTFCRAFELRIFAKHFRTLVQITFLRFLQHFYCLSNGKWRLSVVWIWVLVKIWLALRFQLCGLQNSIKRQHNIALLLVWKLGTHTHTHFRTLSWGQELDSDWTEWDKDKGKTRSQPPPSQKKTFKHVLQIWLANAQLRIIQAATTNGQKNNAANVWTTEREKDREWGRERQNGMGGIQLIRLAAFAYFVANCCSTGC